MLFKHATKQGIFQIFFNSTNTAFQLKLFFLSLPYRSSRRFSSIVEVMTLLLLIWLLSLLCPLDNLISTLIYLSVTIKGFQ